MNQEEFRYENRTLNKNDCDLRGLQDLNVSKVSMILPKVQSVHLKRQKYFVLFHQKLFSDEMSSL